MNNAGNIRILLMDADENSCEEMQEFLQKEGFLVCNAHSAKDGGQVLERMKVDILFLDITLPDGDGLELLREYKSRYPQLEVILISGYGDMNSVIGAMRLRALDFLKKPLRQSDLRSAIERWRKINPVLHPSTDDKNPQYNVNLAI